MKQTAIDWLYDQIENKGKCIYEVIDQARAMEKDQIMNAYNNGDNRSAELYYNETFKPQTN